MYLLAMAALSAVLTWTDNSDNEDGFRIYRQLTGTNFIELSTVPTDVVTYSDPASQPGACYKVTAFNIVGESGFSNTVCLPLPPMAPSGLQAKPVK